MPPISLPAAYGRRRYKYIRFFDTHDKVVPANIDDGASKDFILSHGWLERREPRERLYDLYLDPMERENLVGEGRYRDVYRYLSGRLEELMRQTGDPLLEGKPPKPEGARINTLRSMRAYEQDYE